MSQYALHDHSHEPNTAMWVMFAIFALVSRGALAMKDCTDDRMLARRAWRSCSPIPPACALAPHGASRSCRRK